MIDILIPLGAGSRHDNIELRYCLRSVEKHLAGVGNIWIVGERPEWLRNVVHVPCQDSSNNWMRAWNIYRKIMTGINITEETVSRPLLSDNFLFMNDDHFLLADYDLIANGFPYYHRCSVTTELMSENIPQFRQYQNTIKLIGRDIYDFGIHCPVMYNKKHFCERLPNGKWPEYGYEIKTVYCNKQNTTNGWKQILDLKFREPAMDSSIYRVLEDRPWFSIGDRTLRHGDMRQVLSELYPTKSKWEL